MPPNTQRPERSQASPIRPRMIPHQMGCHARLPRGMQGLIVDSLDGAQLQSWWHNVYDILSVVLGQQLPDGGASIIDQAFALAVASAGLAAFALVLALVEQVRPQVELWKLCCLECGCSGWWQRRCHCGPGLRPSHSLCGAGCLRPGAGPCEVGWTTGPGLGVATTGCTGGGQPTLAFKQHQLELLTAQWKLSVAA